MNKQIEQGSADAVESTVPAQPGIDTVAIPLVSDEAMLRATSAGYAAGKAEGHMLGFDVAMAHRAAQPLQQPAPADAIHQFRKAGASDWYDGHPDNEDGGGPYEARILYAAPVAAPVAMPAASVLPFQQRVQPWMMACFGAEISADTKERNHRFFEESTELVQAHGMTASEAHQLVDYVYGRPVGEPAQEVGGVMVTLAALCLANGLDMDAAAETELARIWTKVEAIRAKQAAKPKHSPLPQAVRPDSGRDAALEEAAASLEDLCYGAENGGGGTVAERLRQAQRIIRALAAHPANVAQVGELSDAGIAASVFEQAAQACDQQADGTNGPYRSACLQCANAVRELRDAAAKKGGV